MMSSWDKCCKGGKFNANLVKTERIVKIPRKIERPKENEIPIVFKNPEEVYVSASSSKKNSTRIEIPFRSFLELGLNSYLLKWLESIRFSSPNRVQNEVLYYLFEGRYKHSVVIAPKKSGKTSAVLLWVLNKIISDKSKGYPKAVVICPTFDKADATHKFIQQIQDSCKIKIFLVVKGTKLNKGEHATADLIIATPDKALELSNSDFLSVKNAKYLIFDDAHCMSDAVGHLKTLSQVFSLLSSKCCIILCTILCNKVLEDFIDKFLSQNQRIEIENVLKKVIPKELFIVYSNNEERVKAFMYLEKSSSYKGQTVVFFKSKDEASRLQTALDAENVSVEILNGNLKPNERKQILQLFKENKIKLLITTYTFMEVLEAENVTKVINYEQILNKEHKLNPDIYGQVENQLNGRRNCLIGSFIERQWEDALFQLQPGSALVYVNAKRISASDLINGQFSC